MGFAGVTGAVDRIERVVRMHDDGVWLLWEVIGRIRIAEDGDAGEDRLVSVDGLFSGIDEYLIGVFISGPKRERMVDENLPCQVRGQSRGLR